MTIADVSGKPTVLIGVVLDKSGSMGTIRDDTIGGFNTFIADQKKDDDSVVLASLTTFNTRVDKVHIAQELDQIEDLDHNSYIPSGGTALFDAVASAIRDMEQALKRQNKNKAAVLMVILTDGQENSSTETTKEQVGKMIKAKEDEGNWTFIFLGADLDNWVGESIGIACANVRNISKFAARDTYPVLSASARSFRKGVIGGKMQEKDDFYGGTGQEDAWDRVTNPDDKKTKDKS